MAARPMGVVALTLAVAGMAAAAHGQDSPRGQPPGEGTCAPDFNGDGIVGLIDLLELLENWGCTPVAGPCPWDLDNDGDVDTHDLVLLLLCWGPCPCPALGASEIYDEILILDVTDAGAAALGLTVSHMYATGDLVQPGDPLAAEGNANLTVFNGTFFQHGAGGDTPPPSGLCGILPDLCYDTFVTNGFLVDDGGAVMLAPGFVMNATTISGTWLTLPGSPARLAVPIPGTGRAGVLIAQISVTPGLGPSSVGYVGDLTLFAGIELGGSGDGQEVSAGFVSCPWDCGDFNGEVDVIDFLALLDQWDLASVPCDFDANGVDVLDFLALLDAWGSCP